MQAIITKALPWIQSREMRIKASCARGSVTLGVSSFDEANHIGVAGFLRDKFIEEDMKRYEGMKREDSGWSKSFVTGSLPDGNYAHVFIN